MSARRKNSARRRRPTENDGDRRASQTSSRGSKRWKDKDGAGSDDVDYGRVNRGADLPTGMAVEPYSLQTHFTQDPRSEGKKAEVSAFGRVQRALGSIWKTTWTENTEDDRELYVKTSLRELIQYVGFIIILCLMTFGSTSSATFYFTKVMKDLFVVQPGFLEYTTMNDFWRYSDTWLMNALYWDKYYNDKPVQEKHKGYIYFENKMLGTPRVRQVRVQNISCTVAEDFRKEIKQCFAPYSKTAEDKATFGVANGSAWTYQSSKQLDGRDVWGQVSTYGGGGYTELLGNNRDDAIKKLKFLKENLWLNRGTRAVFIDLTVYNANINLFCIITLIFEYPATGGLLPSAEFKTLKLLRYVNNMDTAVFVCEVLFLVYLLYYSVEELIEIKINGKGYFKDVWNCFDILLLILGYITIVFIIYVYFAVRSILQGLVDKTSEQYANFATLGSWQDSFNQFVSVFVFLAWIKIFKYISFNKTMTQLQSTLSRCAKDIAGFAVMFFIIFLAYAQWGYLIFGTQVKDFSSYHYCIYTLFRIILGDFDFQAIEQANRVMGPIYFITYVFFVFFVLINMFLAIINDTYAEVKEDLSQQEEEYELGDYFMKGYDKIMAKLSFKKDKIVDIQSALNIADANDDSAVDFEEWRQELKKRGHADAEIEAVFSKYDVDGDRVLNKKEVMEMNDELDDQIEDIDDEMNEVNRHASEMDRFDSRMSSMCGDSDDESSEDGTVPYEEFSVLNKRVDRLEHSIGSIVSKIDSVLLKLEAMDKAKVKRRETMNRLLDSISEQTEQRQGDNRRAQMEKLVRDELEKWDTDMDAKQTGEPDESPKKMKESHISIQDESFK